MNLNFSFHIRLSRHNQPPFLVSVSLLSKPVSCLYKQTSLRTMHLSCKMQSRAPLEYFPGNSPSICNLLPMISYVLISDCMHHDTVAVHLFQKKMIYFSDGAVSQYKSQNNFVNLCQHETHFGVKAEWHFSATSHGKGACDGVRGIVKRLASQASLQQSFDQQIMTLHHGSPTT